MRCKMKADIGIIGAMSIEVDALIAKLENRKEETVGSIKFNTGSLYGKNVVVAKCGVGKVFAAICTEAMIIKYSPSLIVNTGVGGALAHDLRPTDTVVAESLVQHDMDTSPLGDPKGLISGINTVWFDTEKRAASIVIEAAARLGIKARSGRIASGDRFVASQAEKDRIISEFSADVCEMEGAAVAHTAFVNETSFLVVRAISDSADGGANMDYMEFLPIAAKNSTALTLELIRAW